MNEKQIALKLNQLQQNNDELNFYILFDLSQLHRRQRNLPSHLHAYPLWKNVLKMEDERISPQLVSFDTTEPLTALSRLIPPSLQSIPFYSLLVSPMPVEALTAHLGKYSICQTLSDGQHLILRFADTRILPLMETALSAEQKNHFFAPITLWVYPDITGTWQYIEGLGQKEIPLLKNTIELTNQQYEAFLDGTLSHTAYHEVCGYLDKETAHTHRNFIWQTVCSILSEADTASLNFSLDNVVNQCLSVTENHIQQQNATPTDNAV